MERTVRIDFYKCIQDLQSLGTSADQMVSRVFYHLTIDGQTYDLWSNVRQAAGGNYEEDPIEVDSPQGAETPIPLNYMAFQDATERYYRMIIGRANAVFSFRGGTSNVRMYNNTINLRHSEQFEIRENSSAW